MKTYLAKTLAVLAVSTAATVTALGGIKSAIAGTFDPNNLQDFGAPETTAGGGTRGCFAPSSTNKSFTPLTPHNLKLASNREVMPLTVQSHPEFFWYVPETTAEKVEFALGTENGDIVYQAELAVPETAGIMSVSLPREEQYALQEGTRYYWVVSLICDSSATDYSATGHVFVEGWIQRLEADSDLAQKVARSQDPNDFASAGIWQEALAYLARQRRDNPEDSTIAGEWKEFLESVELGQFADVEFVSSQPSARVASDSLAQ
ncbi:MAG: DUF928 domain-containing protein [Cyanobacteria bacterium SBLK]|nr:DUF928 domain-containing protein [Cyanobacteria bacterium SBLK]